MNMCPVSYAEITNDIELFGIKPTGRFSKDERIEEIIEMADRFLAQKPVRFRHPFWGYRLFTMDDLRSEVVGHDLYQSCAKSYLAGNKAPLIDLMIRCARYAVATALYNETTVDQMGFLS